MVKLALREGAVPHVEPIRHVPHAMQEPLKAELDKLHNEGILHKVDISEPIEWLNSFVCVKKGNGKIWLCLDPTHLNKWIIRPRHSAKLVDDILHRLNGDKYFTIGDSSSSFLCNGMANVFYCYWLPSAFDWSVHSTVSLIDQVVDQISSWWVLFTAVFWITIE